MATVSDSDHRSSTGIEFPGENLNCSAEVRQDNAMATKKQVWNKTSNGGVVADGGPVMDEDTWPALVESARSSPKLVADSPPKPTGEVSLPAVAQSSVNLPPQRQAANNAKSNHGLKQPVFARQRPSRQGGGGGGSSMGGPARGFYHPLTPPPPPPFPVFQIPGSSHYDMPPAIIDPFPGKPLVSSSIWDPRAVAGFRPQPNFAADHPNFFPVENLALHSRADGHYYHNNRGGKRDHDRRMYSNVQDAHFQNPMPLPRGFMSPSPPYTSQWPQHVRPYGNPIPPPPPPGECHLTNDDNMWSPTGVVVESLSFEEFAYAPTLPMEPYTDMPPMPQPSIYYPIDPTLSANIVYQIEYYFSDENLIKDEFLRSNMDDQGWVPISLVAGFSRVKKMTRNIRLIEEALKTSTEVEMQDYKIRKRNGWMKWPLNYNRVGTDSTSIQRVKTSPDEEDEDPTNAIEIGAKV